MNPKEIKAEIRRLKKLKLACRPGSKERITLHRQIKDLKKQKAEITAVEPGKEKLIAEILRIEAEQDIKPTFESLGINLNKFSEPELQKHISRLKSRGIK